MVVNGKNVSKFDEDLIKASDEDSDKGSIEKAIGYPKNVHNLHSSLPFLSERMKIKNFNKLVYNLYDKKEYVVHIRTLKQALSHGLILKKYIQ